MTNKVLIPTLQKFIALFKTNPKRDYSLIAKFTLILTMIFFAVFLLIFLTKTGGLHFSKNIDHSIFSNFGQFFGGVASVMLGIASIYLLIQTITETRMAASKNEVEGRFFELLKIQRRGRNTP